MSVSQFAELSKRKFADEPRDARGRFGFYRALMEQNCSCLTHGTPRVLASPMGIAGGGTGGRHTLAGPHPAPWSPQKVWIANGQQSRR